MSGPFMVLRDAGHPRVDAEECALLDAAHCRTMFCNSHWYRDLILAHRRPPNHAPVVVWPAPIDPWPPDPRPARWDLLIYAKNGFDAVLVDRLRRTYPRSVVLRYGAYKREDLHDVASRSRACAYLADCDHGPLALEEILLAGCPTVGVPTGAPFIESGINGFLVSRLPAEDGGRASFADYVRHLDRARDLDRPTVREDAATRFDTTRIATRVITALDTARTSHSERQGDFTTR